MTPEDGQLMQFVAHKPTPDPALARRRAVVDIGSNSVRLVVYNGPLRAPMAICNEKALCGLGRDMADDGSLNALAVADALATLTRFRRLLEEYGDPPTWTIATAAVRHARDGDAFVAAVKKLGYDITVISGAEEAALTALGVVSFEPNATGIAGDMGGGSLELVALSHGQVADTASLRVGALNVMRETRGDVKAAAALIEAALDTVDFLQTKPYDALYSVGGAWRAIARIHMRLRSYPLSVLHHYKMTSAEAVKICNLVSRQSRRSLEDIPGIPRRRIDTLPYAAMVMKSVIRRMAAKTVVVSAGGVREGLLYRMLTEEERAVDPFIAACRFYAERLAPNPAFGEAAATMVEPLFAGEAERARLRFATSLMIDIGAYFHPDLRGRHAFESALSAPFVGVAHKDRVWMALALFSRHQGRSNAFPNEAAIKLLSHSEQQSAVRFGLALRFAASLAPKVEAPMADCRLELESEKLIFRAPADREALMGETPRRRLDALAAAFDAEAIEIYGS